MKSNVADLFQFHWFRSLIGECDPFSRYSICLFFMGIWQCPEEPKRVHRVVVFISRRCNTCPTCSFASQNCKRSLRTMQLGSTLDTAKMTYCPTKLLGSRNVFCIDSITSQMPNMNSDHPFFGFIVRMCLITWKFENPEVLRQTSVHISMVVIPWETAF